MNGRANTAFERWTHDLSLDRVVDTWGWAAEESTGTEQVFGLARVSEGGAEKIIQKSGTNGRCFDPRDWKDGTLAAYRLEWLPKQMDEGTTRTFSGRFPCAQVLRLAPARSG